MGFFEAALFFATGAFFAAGCTLKPN